MASSKKDIQWPKELDKIKATMNQWGRDEHWETETEKTNVFLIFQSCKTPDLSKSVMWWRWEYLDWLQLVRVLHHATLSSCRAATCGAMHLGRQKMETVHGHNSQFSNMAPNTSYPQECLLGWGRSLTAAECVTCVPASAACVSLHCAAPIADIMQHSDILLLQLY